MSNKTVRKTRAIRMVEVCRVLHLMHHRNGLTAYQLAFWMNMKPNANFYKILKEAQRLGWIADVKVEHRPGVLKSTWFATPRGKKIANEHATLDIFPEHRPSLELSDKAREAISDEISF